MKCPKSLGASEPHLTQRGCRKESTSSVGLKELLTPRSLPSRRLESLIRKELSAKFYGFCMVFGRLNRSTHAYTPTISMVDVAPWLLSSHEAWRATYLASCLASSSHCLGSSCALHLCLQTCEKGRSKRLLASFKPETAVEKLEMLSNRLKASDLWGVSYRAAAGLK